MTAKVKHCNFSLMFSCVSLCYASMMKNLRKMLMPQSLSQVAFQIELRVHSFVAVKKEKVV